MEYCGPVERGYGERWGVRIRALKICENLRFEISVGRAGEIEEVAKVDGPYLGLERGYYLKPGCLGRRSPVGGSCISNHVR